ncbi:hypothetical protein CJ194_16760 [Priestia megaterium]|jgi:hypothetical protein|nr:hypothetical protein COI96_08775 [Priestia megaterium]PMD08660.1 hypothetical protein CJ194_16760 [Priestia megaterium]
MGLLDVGQQALNPDKPLSKEHWENSMILFASIIGGAKPVGAVKAVPMVTNVPRVPAHKGTKTLSDMRNVVSPKAASNWSKKVYEPVQKKLQPLLDAEIPTLRPQPQLVGIGEALPGKTVGEALHGLTTYKIGRVASKSELKVADSRINKVKTKVNVNNFNFGAYLRKEKGNPPPGMVNPHAHHVAVKGEFRNRKKITQAYAHYSRELLRDIGIDPIFGFENLHWAPNKGHSNVYIKAVTKKLWEVKQDRGTKEDYEKMLKWIADGLETGDFPPKE